MRADRLVAILLLLQSRGQVTAAEVADELEVSERTARRDLEALGLAGLPIYSKQGRNGGWQLLGGARTDLSGLTSSEARALFLVAGPSSTATPDVKAALRKLVRALPEPFRNDAEAASTAIVTDPNGWGNTMPVRSAPPYLEAVQKAVIEGEQLELGYIDRERNVSQRVLHPLGLATKGQIWYLVADTANGLRTFRIDRIRSITPLGEKVLRPPGFDLTAAWKMISDAVDEKRTTIWARGTASPEILFYLRMRMGNRVRIGPADAAGWVEVEVGSSNSGALAAEIAGFGSGLRLTGPDELLADLASIGRALVDQYGQR
jgi:predicted DNA-binding transcriptional regulator YafY